MPKGEQQEPGLIGSVGGNRTDVPHEPTSDPTSSDRAAVRALLSDTSSGTPGSGTPGIGAPEEGIAADRARTAGGVDLDDRRSVGATPGARPSAVADHGIGPTGTVATGTGTLARLGRSSWNLVGIAAVVIALGWLVWRLRVVVFPLFVAVLLAAVLSPITKWLLRRGVPASAAAALVVVGFLAALVGIGLLIVPAITAQVSELGSQVGEALDRLERWVARERPFGFDGSDIRRLRSDVEGASPDPALIANGARTAGTILAGILFSIIATFFFIRDGKLMVSKAVGLMPPSWRDDAWDIARSIVSSLAGYARGAGILGLVEGAAIGIAVALVGGDLAVVLAVITLLGAFVPFVGAIVAGVVAVGVTFVTAGTSPAIIVAVVALVVQQLDNDFLAPLIYGRFLQIHPLAVLASISVGIETAGLIGAFVAVPIAASLVSIWRVIARRRLREALSLGAGDVLVRPARLLTRWR